MDVLTDVLDTLRLSSTLYCYAELGDRCDLHFLPHHAPVFHIVRQGGCQLQVDGNAAALPLACGDIVILFDGAGHVIRTGTAASFTVEIRLADEGDGVKFIRADDWDVQTGLLCGTFEFKHNHAHPLLKSLPPLLHLAGAQTERARGLMATLDLLDNEAATSRLGSLAMVRRLTDMLFVQIVRCWLELHAAEERVNNSWLASLRDPYISAALERIHLKPDEAWTVQRLAREVALSRSAFTLRFTELVGAPPLKYLTDWRMQRAADLLEHSRLTLAEVAGRVGYESEFAFSKAFKRWAGLAPGQFRRQS
jgi:AraC-like DNA-binding protein